MSQYASWVSPHRFIGWLPFYVSNLSWIHAQFFFLILYPAFLTNLNSGITLRDQPVSICAEVEDFEIKKFKFLVKKPPTIYTFSFEIVSGEDF